jgi:molybdate transport system regulatory protein
MLTSSITHESSRELKLDIGTKVFALIKASSVGIRRRSDVAHGMTLNVLDGIASAVVAGEQKSEVAVLLDGGTELIATLPNPELLSLNIRPGDPVSAVFDHANVIIGIAA